jgi:hypothetical protein
MSIWRVCVGRIALPERAEQEIFAVAKDAMMRLLSPGHHRWLEYLIDGLKINSEDLFLIACP